MSDKKVVKHYRIRGDIAAELEGLRTCLNSNLENGAQAVTETFLVESAIAMFVKRIKAHMAGMATLEAKCTDVSKES